MAITCWVFVASDVSDAVVRIPYTWMSPLLDGEIQWPSVGRVRYGERESRMLEVMLEVDRRRVVRVLRVLPHRVLLTPDGRYDQLENGKMLSRALDLISSPKAIERLQLDASRFWTLNDTQWLNVQFAIGLPLAQLRAAVHP